MAEYITSVDQMLARGAQFPPVGQVRENKRQAMGRLDGYAINQMLHDGRHDKVYEDWAKVLRQEDGAMVELVLNFHRRLSNLWRSLVLTEPPVLKANDEAQEWVDDLNKTSRLVGCAGKVVIDMSRFGVGLFKTTRDQHGKVRVKSQPPFISDPEGRVLGGWFPIVDPMDREEVLAHVLAFTENRREVIVGVPVNRKYLHAEIHRAGSVTRQVWRMDGKVLVELVEEATVETGVPVPLMVPAYNGQTSDNPYGTDDYQDIDPILHELEIRLSQVSKVLDKHADPNLQGPYHLASAGPSAGQAVGDRAAGGNPSVKVGGKFFGRNPEDPKVEYVTWDPNVDMAKWEVETLTEWLYLLSQTSPAAFGQLKAGLAESGSALKRLLVAPLLRAADIRNELDQALTEVIMAANALARTTDPSVPELTSLDIEWQDGLPQDLKEMAEVEAAMNAARLTSKGASIKRVYGLDGEALKTELAAIAAEESGDATVPDPTKLALPDAEPVTE